MIDSFIFDLSFVRQKERFAQDDRQSGIALEGRVMRARGRCYQSPKLWNCSLPLPGRFTRFGESRKVLSQASWINCHTELTSEAAFFLRLRSPCVSSSSSFDSLA